MSLIDFPLHGITSSASRHCHLEAIMHEIHKMLHVTLITFSIAAEAYYYCHARACYVVSNHAISFPSMGERSLDYPGLAREDL